MAGIKSPRKQPKVEKPTIPAVDFQAPAPEPPLRKPSTKQREADIKDPAAIRKRLEQYLPRGIDPLWWARVRMTLIEIVIAAVPNDARMALAHTNVLVMMASLAHMRGLPIEPRNLLSQEAWAQARHTLACKSQKTRNDYQSHVRRMAHAHLPGEWPKSENKQRHVKSVPPADVRDRTRQYQVVDTFSDAHKEDARTFLDLAYYVCLRPDEIRRATGDWVSGQPGDVIVRVTDRSGRSRRVPVAGAPADRLLKRATDVGGGYLIRHGQSRDKAHSVLADLFKHANADLDLNAARKRGLVDLAPNVPATVLAEIGGLHRSSKGLIEIVADASRPTLDQMRNLVQAHYDAGIDRRRA